jgi:hypothetical protein
LLLGGKDDVADDHFDREERSLKFAECPCQGAAAFGSISHQLRTDREL